MNVLLTLVEMFLLSVCVLPTYDIDTGHTEIFFIFDP